MLPLGCSCFNLFQNSKGGSLARLWDKVQRDQTVVEEPPWSGSDYFVGMVAEEPGYAHTADKLYLLNQIRLLCPSCTLMDEEFSPFGLAMVLSKGAPFRNAMNVM